MSRVRTKTVKRASKSLIEKYYPRLSEDFEGNKRIIDSVAYVPSKRLRNKVAGYTSHLMKRIAKGPVNGVSFALQEEERERRDQYVPEKSALDVIVEEGLVIDSQTGDLLKSLGLKVQADVKNFTAAAPERRFKKPPVVKKECGRDLSIKVCLRLNLWRAPRRFATLGSARLAGLRRALSDAPNYLRFNPLPPKQSTRPALYVGPRRWPATDTYYCEVSASCARGPAPLRRPQPAAKSAAARPAPSNLNLNLNRPAEVSPDSVDPGDAVELVSRDGTAQFGLVTFTLPDGSFDCITAQGTLVQSSVSEVAFVLRGLLPPLPSSRYNAPEVSQHLRTLIATSYAGRMTYVPLLRVVYANLSLDDSPRAVDFEDVCSQIARYVSPYDSTMPIDRVDKLGVYLAMAYHCLFFVRTGRSPFTAVPTGTMDAVQKVMQALTLTELEHGVSDMRLGSPSWLGTVLRDFLEHWALWNDPRIARAVVAILEKCENNQRALDSPHAVSSSLERLGGIQLFPWVHERSRPPTAPAAASAHTSSPLFTTNLVKTCVLLDRNTAVSLDDDAVSSRMRLSVYVPYIAQHSSILGRLSPIGIRARTLKLGGTIIPLFSDDEANKMALQHGVARQALRLSVSYDPKSLRWDPESASHGVVEVLPHEPGLDAAELPRISSVLKSIDPLLSDHELQIPGSGGRDAAVLDDQDSSLQGPLQTQGMLATQVQSAAGRIAALTAQLHRIEVPYMCTEHGQERLSSTPKYHERLGTHAYAPVGRPLDSSLALLTQRQLTKPEQIPRLTSSGKPRAPLVTKLKQTIEPQLQLIEVLEDRDEKYWVLRTLQLQLRESAMFHIYRCVVLQASSRRGGHLVPAYCLDLGINVEVFVPAHTEQIFPGDQVIGTEILELDPLQGLFIVSI